MAGSDCEGRLPANKRHSLAPLLGRSGVGSAPSPAIRFSMSLNLVTRLFNREGKLLHSQPFGHSLDLHDDLALRASLGQVFKRILRLLERKNLVDHRTNVFRLEESSNFGELGAVGTHE